ncbi:type IV conjugative transfer system protein TraL [Cupriavidus malaysiensis]|uniref:Type IV conjugative transfer system protein TraL n=1 Tax=Cupriavidus malaysiensis TaxID=367825 RepID=A0ABN4TVE5_9BURK|nr:type IV conjugative transfer system protein TraL [Cupriavidus malaysiensis]AOZ11202.1 type IV conjugative transfer system protein TraL [Cupriavidus malaysiensis]
MKDVNIASHLDALPQLIWFEVDELFPFFICLFVGIYFKIMTPMLVAGVVGSMWYMRQKRDAPRGGLFHMFYYFGLRPLNGAHQNGLIADMME